MLNYRCPRKKQSVSWEVCQARKARKVHGCVTCTYPTKMERARRRIEKLNVSLTTDRTKARNPLVEIVGLAPRKVVIAPQVALALAKQITEKLGAV